MTIWYMDGRECLDNPQAFMRLLTTLHPLEGICPRDSIRKLSLDSDQADRILQIYELIQIAPDFSTFES